MNIGLRQIFILVLGIAFVVGLLPFLAPYPPFQIRLEDLLQWPSAKYFLGTDGLGRDVFSQILFGLRTSLAIGLVVVSISVLVGLVVGGAAGYLGGWPDRIFLFVADVFQAFPGVLLAIALAAFLQPSLINLIFLLSFVGWVSYARVVRAQIAEMKSREFIQAGLAMGFSRRRLLFKHFLPNIMGPLVVQASFGMAGAVMAESTLSFLGLGLPDHVASLGKIIDSGVGLLIVAPHVAFFPGLAIMAIVLTFNFLGDALRARMVGV